MTAFLRSAPVQQWVTWRFFRWLLRSIFSWRTARRALLTAATLATLIAVFYAVENWRGQRAWQRTKRELESKGERLELAAFIPPPIPDEQNFAMAPFWRNALGDNWQLSYPAQTMFNLRSGGRAVITGDWRMGQRANLEVWQKYYRDMHSVITANAANLAAWEKFPIPSEPGKSGEDVLLALSRYGGPLNELRDAARRPAARFPLQYENVFEMTLPHLSPLHSVAPFLWLRTLAELDLGRTEAALEDVRLSYRLVGAIRTEPILVSHIVRARICEWTLAAIWQGAADHRWTDTQLVALEAELQRLDFLSDFNTCRESERIVALLALDRMQTSRDPKLFKEALGLTYPGPPGLREPDDRAMWLRVFRAMPRGWFDRNKVSYTDLYQRLGSALAPGEFRSSDWHQAAPLLDEAVKLRAGNFLAVTQIAWQPVVSRLFIQTEAFVRLARTACALERYRLAHGRYPESLDALAPRFIDAVPRDVIDGGELKYRRTNDDRFVLYSIGWNGKDDAGEIALKGTRQQQLKNRIRDDQAGDWVWKYPAD